MARMPSPLTQELIDAMNKRTGRGRGRGRGETATAALLSQIRYAGLPMPVTEFRFCPGRKWAVDLCWPDFMLAVEVEGLVYSNKGDNALAGRHVSVSGYAADLCKYNELTILGFRLVRVTSKHARDGSALGWIERALTAAQSERPAQAAGR